MLSAFTARAGVYAAQLAQRGITAPPDVIEDKFKECFSIGVRPLSAAQYARLKARVQDVHHVADMSRFFEEISFPP